MTDLILIGLHLTKCAGTSLISTIRRNSSEDEYLFFSSYYENALASRPVLSRVFEHQRLRVVFGHYTNEVLLRLFQDRRVFLFTGMRDPVERAISEFGQINAALAMAGGPPMEVREYFEANANGMCREILRCFPSVAKLTVGPAWVNARAALSLCDFVYSTAEFARDATFILKQIDIGPERLVADNLTDAKPLSDGVRAALNEARDVIPTLAGDYLADDIQLFNEMYPFLGTRNFPVLMQDQSWALDRAAYVEALPDAETCRSEFSRLEIEYLVYEFAMVGKLALLRHILESERAYFNKILERVADYE